MAIISPVSDISNCGTVLEKVSVGSSVSSTANGSGKRAMCNIDGDEELNKAKAMLYLMYELNEGRRSGEEEGYVSSDDVRKYFHGERS